MFEDRERGSEADVRHQLYVQNAYAALSKTRQIVRCGALAGLHAGAVLVAVFGVALFVMMLAWETVDRRQSATLYGNTPLVGTIFEPLWPLILSLGALPFCAMVGLIAALVLREELQRLRLLDHYFEPVRTRFDLVTFIVLATMLMFWGTHALGLRGAQTDLLGLLILCGAVGSLIAWPVHSVWQKWYLRMIRNSGSASLHEITDLIRRQF